MEAMYFRCDLNFILNKFLIADPRLEPVYLSKLDLANTYMRLWVRMRDLPSVTFLIPKETPSYQDLVGFHLSLLMW